MKAIASAKSVAKRLSTAPGRAPPPSQTPTNDKATVPPPTPGAATEEADQLPAELQDGKVFESRVQKSRPL